VAMSAMQLLPPPVVFANLSRRIDRTDVGGAGV
jgi:hypothetical protein